MARCCKPVAGHFEKGLPVDVSTSEPLTALACIVTLGRVPSLARVTVPLLLSLRGSLLPYSTRSALWGRRPPTPLPPDCHHVRVRACRGCGCPPPSCGTFWTMCGSSVLPSDVFRFFGAWKRPSGVGGGNRVRTRWSDVSRVAVGNELTWSPLRNGWLFHGCLSSFRVMRAQTAVSQRSFVGAKAPVAARTRRANVTPYVFRCFGLTRLFVWVWAASHSRLVFVARIVPTSHAR